MAVRPHVLAAIFALAVALPHTAVAQVSDTELRCRSMVNGNVAWNQAGATQWATNNINSLCAGAANPEQRIACFSNGIASHNDWGRAITECASVGNASQPMVQPRPVMQAPPVPPPAPPPPPQAVNQEARCRTMIDGKVAWNQLGSKSWSPSNIDALCAGATNAEARISCFSAGISAHNDWVRATADCKSGNQSSPAPPASNVDRTSSTSTVRQNREPGLCQLLLQGKVPMSLPNGSTNWDAARLNRLCGNSQNSLETVKCFSIATATMAGTANATDRAISACQ
jgi:hypothetical protein